VWCNFPAVGAEHRARLINETLAPMMIGRAVTHPSEVFDHLSAATSVLALQFGEPGPFAHAIAGVDIALWDLFVGRAKTPLWWMLGGSSGRRARPRQSHGIARLIADHVVAVGVKGLVDR
jgi:D-galactarolactone cycloisomerase